MVKVKTNKKNSLRLKNISVFNIFRYKYLIISVFFLFLLFFGIFAKINGFNKGIDFAGGIVFEAQCEKCDSLKIANKIEKELNISIQHQRTSDGFVLKTTSTDNYDKKISVIKNILSKNHAKIISNDFASPQMTKTFIDDSIFACIFAFICIGLYIIIRFNFKFALSTIIALLYDVLMVVCFVSFAKIEVCLITLTAILTIIGYCVNDKIVIFDNIKSNLDEKTKDTTDIINESVKIVLMRSILTSLTTIIVSISLLFFGDRIIYELGITIIFGISVGTISSILLAPSLLLSLNVKHIEKKQLVRDPLWYTS